MKLFIDTASIDEIKEAAEWAVIDGVTTNPSLIAQGKKGFKELVREITDIVEGPVSVEIIGLDSESMVKEAIALSGISKNVVIKIPMTQEGLKAVRILNNKGIRTNVTLVFSVNQAILAAKAKASYLSIFIGRLDDLGFDGMEIVRDTVRIFKTYDFKTDVIAASIRHPRHVVESALAGAHAITVPYNVLKRMYDNPLTDSGLETFLKDWRNFYEHGSIS